MRVVFMGTSAFAVPALSALALIDGVTIPAVYTQPPRKAGRGQKLQKTDIHKLADILGFPVCTPLTLKTEEETERLAKAKPDLVLVASYGLLLPPTVLALPRLGCVNIHASSLPRWRGASPIQQALLHGDASTGVDFFQMEKGLDTGAILMRSTINIHEDDTGGSLHDRLANLAKSLVPEFLEKLRASELTPEPQDTDCITIAPRIEKAESVIDWTRSAVEIERMIRAFDPWPGAWSNVGDERLRFLKAGVRQGQGDPGHIVEAPLLIATGDGLLDVQSIQRAGRKPMSAQDLLRGFELPPGTYLGKPLDA